MNAEPCPFCGGSEIGAGHESAMAFHAWCLTCGARTRPFEIPAEWPDELDHDTDLTTWLTDKAMQAWNRRVDCRDG